MIPFVLQIKESELVVIEESGNGSKTGELMVLGYRQRYPLIVQRESIHG